MIYPTAGAIALLLALAVLVPGQRASAVEGTSFEERAAAIEAVSKAPDGDRVVLGHLSRLLRISAERLRTERARTGLGWGELMIAHRLSREAGTAVESVIDEFRAGRSWAEIARGRKVDVGKLMRDVQRSQEAVEQRTEDRGIVGDVGTRLGPSPGGPASSSGPLGHRGH